jgi:hypothetical protein
MGSGQFRQCRNAYLGIYIRKVDGTVEFILTHKTYLVVFSLFPRFPANEGPLATRSGDKNYTPKFGGPRRVDGPNSDRKIPGFYGQAAPTYRFLPVFTDKNARYCPVFWAVFTPSRGINSPRPTEYGHIITVARSSRDRPLVGGENGRKVKMQLSTFYELI